MSLSPSTIVTERLTLEPLVPVDADAMFAVLDDERMHEFTGGSPLTLEELRSRYDRLAVGQSADRSELWFNWIVRTTVDATPVGVMQATVAADGSSADVAWEVGVPWQGRGIAGEAAHAVVSWLVEHDVPVIQRARPSRPRGFASASPHVPGWSRRTSSTTVRSSGSAGRSDRRQPPKRMSDMTPLRSPAGSGSAGGGRPRRQDSRLMGSRR